MLKTYIIIKGDNLVFTTDVHQDCRMLHWAHQKLFAENKNKYLTILVLAPIV